MSRVMVRYRVKPDQVAANEALVRDVYAELERVRPEGLSYATFKLEDGVSFVHLAAYEGERSPLGDIGAFDRFQAGVRDRCDEPPVVMRLAEVGSFRFDGDAS
jgi:hypothetical protein